MFRSASSATLHCHFCLHVQPHASSSTAPPPPRRPRPPAVDDADDSSSSSSRRPAYSWHCEACGCLNGWDVVGRPLSYHPTMSTPAANPPSRAYPPPTHLTPPTFPSPLCPTCTSHATLQANLLAAYLPEPSSPDYRAALEGEQAYRARLDERYPLVCPRCEGRVDEALRKADYRGRTAVLGGFLKPVERARRRPPDDGSSSGALDDDHGGAQSAACALSLVWQSKRVLWFASLALGLAVPVSHLHPYMVPSSSRSLLPTPGHLLALHLASPVWMFWDPTWPRHRRSRQPAARPERKAWIGLMGALWLLRVAAAGGWAAVEWFGDGLGGKAWEREEWWEIAWRMAFAGEILLPLIGWSINALAARKRARSAALRTIKLVRPASSAALRRTPTSSDLTPGLPISAVLDPYQAHYNAYHPVPHEPVFGQAGFAAARAAGSFAPSLTDALPPADGTAVEAMDVDGEDDGKHAHEPPSPSSSTSLSPPTRRRPLPRPAPTRPDDAPSDDPWRGFLRAPRAFGQPGGVMEVEPGGAVERLVEEWRIDDGPRIGGGGGGKGEQGGGGWWLGRVKGWGSKQKGE